MIILHKKSLQMRGFCLMDCKQTFLCTTFFMLAPKLNQQFLALSSPKCPNLCCCLFTYGGWESTGSLMLFTVSRCPGQEPGDSCGSCLQAWRRTPPPHTCKCVSLAIWVPGIPLQEISVAAVSCCCTMIVSTHLQVGDLSHLQICASR